jgi:hypothetical protein
MNRQLTRPSHFLYRGRQGDLWTQFDSLPTIQNSAFVKFQILDVMTSQESVLVAVSNGDHGTIRKSNFAGVAVSNVDPAHGGWIADDDHLEIRLSEVSATLKLRP